MPSTTLHVPNLWPSWNFRHTRVFQQSKQGNLVRWSDTCYFNKIWMELLLSDGRKMKTCINITSIHSPLYKFNICDLNNPPHVEIVFVTLGGCCTAGNKNRCQHREHQHYQKYHCLTNWRLSLSLLFRPLPFTTITS